MSKAAAGYLSALGVMRWRRRVPAITVDTKDVPVAAAALTVAAPRPASAWQCLRAASAPRLAFIFASAPQGEEAVLATRIAAALALDEGSLSFWAATGEDMPEALSRLPCVSFGVPVSGAALATLSLADLLASPTAKAMLWRELQARILPIL